MSETIPLVATAPVVPEVAFSNEPDVKPVDDELKYIAWPVVKPFPKMDSIVPAVVELAVVLTNPTFEVDVYAPVALNEIAPLVATAPVVAEVAYTSDPDVKPVEEDEIYIAWPVVSAFPEILWMVPAVVELAATFTKPMLEVEVKFPEALKEMPPLVATAPVVADET